MHTVSVAKPKGKRLLGRARCRCENIKKYILEKWNGAVWTGSATSGYRQVVGSCEHDSEPSVLQTTASYSTNGDESQLRRTWEEFEYRVHVCKVGTMLQAGRSEVPFPIRSLDFSVDLILPAALWP
jgi:hypothetical protein